MIRLLIKLFIMNFYKLTFESAIQKVILAKESFKHYIFL